MKIEKHNSHGLRLVVTLSPGEAENLARRLELLILGKEYINVSCLFEDDNNRWEPADLTFVMEGQ